jgi:hypothetical protein
MRRTTLTLWTLFVLLMAGFYLVTSWTPTLPVEAGLSASHGRTSGTLLNLGGSSGPALLCLLTARWTARHGPARAWPRCACCSPSSAAALRAALGIHARAAHRHRRERVRRQSLRAHRRGARRPSAGHRVGVALGVGRIGVIITPIAAGGLLDAGWSPLQVAGPV